MKTAKRLSITGILLAIFAISGPGSYAQPSDPAPTAESSPGEASAEAENPGDTATSGEGEAPSEGELSDPDGSEASAELPTIDDLMNRVGEEPLSFAEELYITARAGQWRKLAVLVLSGLMFLFNWVRKTDWLKDKIDLSGDRAGAITVLVLGAIGGVVTALAADQPLSIMLIADGLWNGVNAAGLFTVAKRIWKPKD